MKLQISIFTSCTVDRWLRNFKGNWVLLSELIKLKTREILRKKIPRDCLKWTLEVGLPQPPSTPGFSCVQKNKTKKTMIFRKKKVTVVVQSLFAILASRKKKSSSRGYPRTKWNGVDVWVFTLVPRASRCFLHILCRLSAGGKKQKTDGATTVGRRKDGLSQLCLWYFASCGCLAVS